MWCVTFKCLRCCRKADGTVLKSAAWINDEQRSWVLCYRGHYFFVIFSFVLTGLTLVSAPHLARSYHHLFALEAFEEAPRDASDKEEPQWVVLYSKILHYPPYCNWYWQCNCSSVDAILEVSSMTFQDLLRMYGTNRWQARKLNRLCGWNYSLRWGLAQ